MVDILDFCRLIWYSPHLQTKHLASTTRTPAARTTPPTACRLRHPFIPARPGTSLGQGNTLLSLSTPLNLSTARHSLRMARPSPNSTRLNIRTAHLSQRTGRPSNPMVHPSPNTRLNTTNPTRASHTRAGVAGECDILLYSSTASSSFPFTPYYVHLHLIFFLPRPLSLYLPGIDINMRHQNLNASSLPGSTKRCRYSTAMRRISTLRAHEQ
ncbi:uncharacterized protein SCHCODRAFT_02497775 [Schizophyllum commune H4-8]|uniref:uncharacterized protein n=1 Tax=Schizophyllum commune (strain H4-8 / FGSC 9210) TaxID=578458 RepID=UPI00215E4949|nr:uncharacterized protein SCHCODRAFT_02497775 [Schizophyllum commune H4-8]KAI5894749.1 hypothetical protein SCHCODRAFT_02497775 [Schizophyllum commune H4-8]